MEIKEFKIDEIRPDPEQPRQRLNKEYIEELAQSIRIHGIINPIEIDENNVIITGEMRWRAAKIAGLSTIACKVVLRLDSNHRFKRQLIENIQRNDMTPWDTANAIIRLAGSKKNLRSNEKGYSQVARELGKSVSYIQDHVFLVLGTPKALQEEVKTGKINLTYIRPLRRLNPKYKKQVESKILKEEFNTRDGLDALVIALNNHPEKAEKLLKIDFSKYKTTAESISAIGRIIPSWADRVNQSFNPSRQIAEIRKTLVDWIKNNPRDQIGKFHKAQVISTLSGITAAIERWNNGNKH